MKIVIFILCILSLKLSVLANKKYLPECKKDDCFCKDRSIIDNISNAAGRLEFLKNQRTIDDNKFKIECDKVDEQLRNKWGNLAEVTDCEQVKVFIKKQLVLWEFFCSFDKDFRQEFNGEFFEKFEECDKVIFQLCLKEGIDYCETSANNELLKCVDEDMKDKCANHKLFAQAVRKNQKFLKDNNRCGANHPGALNHHKRSPS